MDCRAAYVCIALSQNRGFFFAKVLSFSQGKKRVRLKMWISLFPLNSFFFKFYFLQQKTFLSPKQYQITAFYGPSIIFSVFCGFSLK